MATRNILHISKLQEFEGFLETKGYMIVAKSKNPYEVLRAQKDGDTVIVYKKKDAKEHLSTMDKDYHLVREFIKSQRKQSNGDRIRGMSDKELAHFISILPRIRRTANLGMAQTAGGGLRNGKADTGFNWKKIWNVGSNRISRERILFVQMRLR